MLFLASKFIWLTVVYSFQATVVANEFLVWCMLDWLYVSLDYISLVTELREFYVYTSRSVFYYVDADKV